MPLSEADFYAYSRATGTPVPRDAQERAEIAPQVLGFRQGQLSATKEELDRGNFIDMAGKTALVAGLGAGATALATGGRFGKLRGALANVIRPKDAGATTGVRTVDLNKTNIPVEKGGKTVGQIYVQDVTPSAVATPARSFDPPDERMGKLFKSLEQAIPEPTEKELARAIPFDRTVKSKEEAYSAAVQRRPVSSAAEQEYIPDIEGGSQPKEVYLSQSQQQRQDLENLRASRGDTQLELKGPEFKSNISQLLKDSEQEAIFPVQNLYKTTSSQAAIDFSPRSYLESTGAVAPSSSSPASRRARNQQKDLDRIRSSMSDVIDSVIDEDYLDTEAPSSLLKLANRIQNPDIPLTTETVQEYKNWAQKTFANDPTVLSEINENLSSLPSLRGAVAPGPSSVLRKGRDSVDVLLDEREAAEIRRIRQADRAQEAKVIGKGERLLAELQAEKPQVSSWPEISGKLKQLDVSISGAPEAQGGSGIDLTFGTKVGDREFNLYSPQSQQMLEKVGLTANQVEEGWVSNLKSKGILESSSHSTLVEQQNARRPLVSEQSVEAVDTGADQQTGRVMQSLQRNEDLDLGQIEIMEDMAKQSYYEGRQQPAPQEFADAAINEVAASLPDGLPIDQAEGIKGITNKALRQDKITYLRQQNQQRRAELEARGLRGTKLERALAQPFVTKANIKLESTGPTISQTTLPQEYRKVVPSTEMETVDKEGNIVFRNIAPKTIVNVGPDAEITKTPAGTAIRGQSPSYHEAFPTQSKRLLEGPFEEEIPDVTNPIPITTSLQTGNISRLSVQPIAEEFTPGAGEGVYGVEPGFVPGPTSATASIKPTDMFFEPKKQNFEALNSSQLRNFISNAPEGRVQEAGKRELARREKSQSSVAVSEIMRRARIEGRDPNMVLRQYGFNI